MFIIMACMKTWKRILNILMNQFFFQLINLVLEKFVIKLFL